MSRPAVPAPGTPIRLRPPRADAGVLCGYECYRQHQLGAVLTAVGVDLGGATLDAANDVSADGHVVVGQGTSADGKRRAFRAVLPR